MSRHDRDVVSLMGGVALVLVAVAFLLTDLTTLRVDARWAGPVVLVVVGTLGVFASLRRTTPHDDGQPLP